MKKLLIIFMQTCVFFFFSGGLFAQDFKIYYLRSRYDKTSQDFLSSHNLYHKYYWIGESVLTPNHDGVLDKERIEKWLEQLFPNKTESAYVNIDIEGVVLKAIREGTVGEEKFENAKKVFIQAIDIIKNSRPNLQVGVYGLPSRIYYERQYKNDDHKIYPIIEKCDYISPSLYIIYPDQQKGAKRNDEYLEFNLKRALEISNDLGKPVIPFVWPFVHTINKVSGGQLLNKSAMNRYIQTIKDFEYKGKKASGVLWWEASQKSGYSTIIEKERAMEGLSKESVEKENNILIESTKSFLK